MVFHLGWLLGILLVIILNTGNADPGLEHGQDVRVPNTLASGIWLRITIETHSR